MTIKYQLLFALLMLVGIVLKCYSYYYNDNTFWKTFDVGSVLISLGIIIAVYRWTIPYIVAWLYFALNINSAITSLFFDVTKFEINQKIIGWIVASIFFSIGVIINVFKWIIAKQVTKKNELCKKDARDKYKDLISRIYIMEQKMDLKANLIDEFLKRISHG